MKQFFYSKHCQIYLCAGAYRCAPLVSLPHSAIISEQNYLRRYDLYKLDMIKLDNKSSIVSATAIFDDGKTVALVEKRQRDGSESKNLFFNELLYGSFVIKLRIDWSDINADNDPRLDADIFKDDKKYTDNRNQWHHTDRKIEDGLYAYVWTPQTQELKNLKVEMKFQLELTKKQTILGVATILEAPKKH